MSDSDLSLRASLSNPVDGDATYPTSSQGRVLQGSQAAPKTFAQAERHPTMNPNPSCHSHPEPISVAEAATNGMLGTMNDEDASAYVTTAGQHYTESLHYHDLVSKSTDIEEYRMLADQPNRQIPTGLTTPCTLSTAFDVPLPTTKFEHGHKLATDPTTLDNDPPETTTAVNASTPTATPLRQAHLNTLLASLIPAGPSSPPKKAGRVSAHESEDSFDSGSEQEDESDVDFQVASITPSVRSKSPSPVPTPPGSDHAQRKKVKQPARVQTSTATPAEKKRRPSSFGDWPVASQARMRSTTVTDTPVTDYEMAESSSNDDGRGPLDSGASEAAEDSVPVPSTSPSTTAGPTTNTTSPNMVASTAKTAKKQEDSSSKSKKRAWEQMLESEANANRELQMMETMVKETENAKEKAALVATRKDKNSSQRIRPTAANADDGEVRNGNRWTLVVDKDLNGNRTTKWTVGRSD
ncbi:MAG: hypothetical protein Q9168_000118 [Polycauliona sp. 1 TL-2023]